MSWRIELVDSLYRELAEQGSLQTAMELVGQRLDATCGIVQLLNRRTGEVRGLASYQITDELYRHYQRYAPADPWPGFYERAQGADGEPILSQDIADEKELRATDFYVEFWKARGFGYSCGVVPRLDSEWSLYIGFPRDEDQAPYGEDDLPDIRFATTHLRHAALLLERVADADDRAALRAHMLDRLNFAAILLTANGRVRDANRPARALIRPGGAFREYQGRLTGVTPEVRDELEGALKAMNAATPAPPGPFPVTEASSGRRWIAYLWPLGDEKGTDCCLVLLNPEQGGDDACQALARLFGLTAAESAVLLGLNQGMTLAQIAEQRGVSVTTVRTQLKSMLSKTHCHSQSQLVALCARMTPPLAGWEQNHK